MELQELREIEFILFDAIEFMSSKIIPEPTMSISYDLVKEIDMNDAVFIALTIYTSGKLWTLDKKLITGLEKKGYKDIVTTKEVKNKYSTL